MSRAWTVEERRRQAELIGRWRPWQSATGPKSAAGKTIVARNADRGDPRGTMRATRLIDRLVKDDQQALAKITASHRTSSNT